MNNNGVYHGLTEQEFYKVDTNKLPATALLPGIRYDLVAVGCGGVGFNVTTSSELRDSLKEALRSKKPALINIHIEPAEKKKLVTLRANNRNSTG